MPAAPSLEALSDTQDIFETALAAYFTANGLTGYTSRGAADMSDTRIQIIYEPGPSTGHQATRTTTGTGWPELDWFNGNVMLLIRTDRVRDTASPDATITTRHDYNVARCKVLMMRGALNGTIAGITALSLPYHTITVQGFSGQQDTTTDDAFDECQIGYAIQMQIRPDAWPVATP
jgi:hypothetical protein